MTKQESDERRPQRDGTLRRIDWYRRDVDDATDEFDVSVASGLSATEAERRLGEYGPNRIETEEPPSWFSFFWRHLTEFVSLLLVFVAGVSFATYVLVPNPPIDRLATGIIVLGIVLINATVGAYQEYRSVNTARELRKLMQTNATVRRDGEIVEVDSETLVPGDVVHVESGDKVPADLRLFSVENFEVDEAVLTGESATVSKSTATIAEERPLAERTNMAYTNTFVTRGGGTGVVVATGASTEMGTIAKATESASEEAPFVGEVQETAMTISKLAIGLVVVASIVFFFYGKDLFEIFLLAAALIVGAIPAALPVTVTYALTDAMRKMARENALVKNLALLETVGGVDVICTDKTGTLTQNRMTVAELLVPGDSPVRSADDFDPEAYPTLVRCALLANEAERSEDGYLGDPEDIGLVEFAAADGVEVERVRAAERLDFLPFSSEWKMVQALVREEGSGSLRNGSGTLVEGLQTGSAVTETDAGGDAVNTVRYAKGAPEVILARSDRVLVDGEVRPLTDEWRGRIEATLDEFSSRALRNLAFSYKAAAAEGVGVDTAGDVFLGAVGMWDPPREGVRDAIRTVYGAGIDVKMITGDGKQTAVAIAEECGFEDIRAVAWEDVKDATDAEMEEIVQSHNVFARMDPALKMSMVHALHRLGKRVAITGDGVNDVPPIEAAEVGVAMGQRGSDITRDAADIILLDDAFPTIQHAIRYGRAVLSNVRKTVNYLLTANLFEVVVVFVSSLLGFTPFQAIQLLWVNFATDIFPAMALGSDPPHDDIMEKRPTGAEERILTKRIWYLLVGISSVKVVAALVTFFAVLSLSTGTTTILGITGDLTLAQTSIFVWLGLSHVIRIVTIRWDEGWHGRKVFVNRWVNLSLAWPVVAFLVILYTPLAPFFQATPLPLWTWGVVLASILVSAAIAVAVTEGIDYTLGGYADTEY